MLEHTLRAVNAAERVDEIILVTREDLMMPGGPVQEMRASKAGEGGAGRRDPAGIPCWQEPLAADSRAEPLRCKTEPDR